MKRLAISLAVLALAGCAGGGSRYGGPPLKPVANPSAVIATELAFARAAQVDGQWEAFREFAADGALILGANGAIEAEPWLKEQTEPREAVRWRPLQVWSSCDGSMAVTQIAFTDPSDGENGLGYTVWRRNDRAQYRWTFDLGWKTDDRPETNEMISASVADCTPIDIVSASAWIKEPKQDGSNSAKDGTLEYSFAFFGDGERHFSASIWKDGSMQQIASVDLPAAKADQE